MSAVCAADLNQTTDNVKTDDDKDINALDDDIIEYTGLDCIVESADNQVSDDGNCSLDGKDCAAVEDDNQTFINYTVTNETVIVPENPIHWGVPKIPGFSIDETEWHPYMPIPGMTIPINLTLGEPIFPLNTTPLHPVIAVGSVVKEFPLNKTPLRPIDPGMPVFPKPRPILPMNTTSLHPVIAVGSVVKEIPLNKTPLRPIGPGVPVFPIPEPIIPIPTEPGIKVYSGNFEAASDSVPNGWLVL